MPFKTSAVVLAMCTILAMPVKSQDSHNTVPDEPFVIRTGLNVSHWLSQSDARGKERERFMTNVDFQKISAMGFDHVRIPVDEVQLWDSTGRKENETFPCFIRQYSGQ
jgi:endoglucanase